MKRIREASPRLRARIAGAFSLLAMLMGIAAEFGVRGTFGSVAYIAATLCNVAVTLFFYDIFRPVSRSLASFATFFGLMVSVVGVMKWHPQGVDIGLIDFGIYCLLIGYLVFRSAFLPRILGVLMAFAGLAWLTFLSQPLAHSLSPYNMAAGVLGQLSLTLWLLVFGVDAQRWKEQASAAMERRLSRASQP
jgi:hypothetical protein